MLRGNSSLAVGATIYEVSSVCTQARSWDELPDNAQKYVQRVQQLIGVECRWIGVGPGRDAIVVQPSPSASQNGSQSRTQQAMATVS